MLTASLFLHQLAYLQLVHSNFQADATHNFNDAKAAESIKNALAVKECIGIYAAQGGSNAEKPITDSRSDAKAETAYQQDFN